MGPGSRRRVAPVGLGLLDDGIAQQADAFDFYFADVAGFHEAGGGLREKPTPEGVPVTITSPGARVKMAEA